MGRRRGYERELWGCGGKGVDGEGLRGWAVGGGMGRWGDGQEADGKNAEGHVVVGDGEEKGGWRTAWGGGDGEGFGLGLGFGGWGPMMMERMLEGAGRSRRFVRV